MIHAESTSVTHRDTTTVNLVNFSNGGHRPSYNQVLTTALARLGIGVSDCSGPSTVDFFPIADDNMPAFLWRALLNCLRGRRTVGLFFRPAECFLETKPRRLKRIVLKLFRHVPNKSILTILPFEVDDRFRTIADDWIFDPQFWDLDYLPPHLLRTRSGLTEEIHRAAAGRKILVALGAQNIAKGFDFCARLWCERSELREKFLFVVAGAVASESHEWANHFAEANGVLFDRFASDEELFELYDVADVVWSCYAPHYNQSSGVFGRAFQLAKPSIVRERSLLVTLSDILGQASLAIPFGDTSAASARLLAWDPPLADRTFVKKKVEQIRHRDLSTLAHVIHPK